MNVAETPEPEEPEPYCHTCENGGWVQVFSHRPPAFDTCPDCCNPEDYPCP